MGGLGVAVRLGITASLGQAMERWRCAVQLDKRVRFDDEHVHLPTVQGRSHPICVEIGDDFHGAIGQKR